MTDGEETQGWIERRCTLTHGICTHLIMMMIMDHDDWCRLWLLLEIF
ncbi:hypothetical protein Hanom_Chr09g00787701 [Helianthus anomalus]